MAAKEKPAQHPEYNKEPLDRRTFVKRAATAAGIGAAASYLLLAPEDWPGSLKDESGLRSKPRVKPLMLDDFRVARPASAFDVGVGRGANTEERLRKALGAVGGLTHYVEPGDIVLLKPNVAFDRSPNLGATTDPEIVELLVRMLLVDCRAQEVRVADNPIESPADCFAKSGIRRAAEKAGGRIYLPDGNAFKMLHTENAELIEDWLFFHRPLTNVDKVIGVAPVKDHNLCHASLGLKNWYGLLGGRRNQFHQDIHGIISDLSLMIKPTLSILDGGRVLMRNGPTGGDPSDVKAADAVVAGIDPVAVDAWAYEHLLERGREYPGYLYRAEEKGSGKVDYSGRVGEKA
jgi:uncharacterized protein (DUF362 family)